MVTLMDEEHLCPILEMSPLMQQIMVVPFCTKIGHRPPVRIFYYACGYATKEGCRTIFYNICNFLSMFRLKKKLQKFCGPP
jgi:hypothetical protein